MPADQPTAYRLPPGWTLNDKLFIAAAAVLLPALLWPFVKFFATYPSAPFVLRTVSRWLLSIAGGVA